MSILDQTGFAGNDPEKVMKAVEDFMAAFERESDLSDDVKALIAGLKEGQTMAQMLGISRDELEVIYTVGFNLLNNGDLEKAKDVFTQLVMLDGIEAKYQYCLGYVFQQQGDYATAAKMYVNFLALDATNAEGYMRLGECLLASGERPEALECFEIAEAEAARGNGSEATLALARRNIAALKG